MDARTQSGWVGIAHGQMPESDTASSWGGGRRPEAAAHHLVLPGSDYPGSEPVLTHGFDAMTLLKFSKKAVVPGNPGKSA